MSRAQDHYHYDHVAWCYEWMARVFSFGAIPRVKASQTSMMQAGQRVLYVGVGTGEDALLAAREGVHVTCLDLSGAMLDRLRRRFAAEGIRAEIVEADIVDYECSRPFDVVVANFVLNVFPEAAMRQVLRHIESLLSPEGILLIADFTPPGQGIVERAIFPAYYRPINIAAWLLRLCALHPIYDYAQVFPDAGLEIVTRSSQSAPRHAQTHLYSSRFYECIVAKSLRDRP
jgi:demethylphylloquinol methyltransferase